MLTQDFIEDQVNQAKFDTQDLENNDPNFKIPAFTVAHPEYTYLTIDQALQYTGDNSKYSKRTLYILCLLWLSFGMLTMGFPIFFQGSEYICTNNSGELFKCNMNEACRNPDKLIITGPMNIIREFELYCKNSHLAAYAGTIYFIAMLFGTIAFPFLTDSKGRKPSLLICTFLSGIAFIGCAFSPNVWCWIACVCVAGFGLGGMETISMVYVSEISATNFRNNAGTALLTTWSLSQIIMGVIYNFVGYWRYMFLFVMGIPYLLGWLAVLIFMDETPRYQAMRKRYEDAKKVLKRICRTNQRPPFMFRLAGEMEQDNAKFFVINEDANVSVGGTSFLETSAISMKSMKDMKKDRLGLFKSKKYRLQTFIMFFIWGVRFFVYFGIQFTIDQFGESDIYLNFTFMGIAELMALAISAPIKRRFKRKNSMQFCQTITGFSLLAVYFDFQHTLSAICNYFCLLKKLVAKLSVTVFFTILVTYTAELYPTEIRTKAYGVCLAAGRYFFVC